MQKPGYHLNTIPKGTFGGFSKILEEVAECQDAIEQDSKIMLAVELSDLYGALEGFALKHGLTMLDLKTMSDITQRAFINGHRKPKND